jgi:hypothetical protein
MGQAVFVAWVVKRRRRQTIGKPPVGSRLGSCLDRRFGRRFDGATNDSMMASPRLQARSVRIDDRPHPKPNLYVTEQTWPPGSPSLAIR